MNLEILYCDASLLAVNKPPGVLVLPDGYDPAAPHLRSLLEPDYGRLWIVHRLDRATSGLVLLARSAAAHRALNDQFAARRVSKIYHALAARAPEWTEQTVDLPLRANAGRRRRTLVDFARGKEAITHLRVLERFASGALLEARPATGRTHQIRAHLAAAGCPLLGDQLYGLSAAGSPSGNPAGGTAGGAAGIINRVGLHALSLAFQHPASGAPQLLAAPYAADFAAALDALRN